MTTRCLYKNGENVCIIVADWLRGVSMATNKIQTGIRFEPELLYKITLISKQNKRSLNAQLEFLAQQCVDNYEKEKGKIEVTDELLYIDL